MVSVGASSRVLPEGKRFAVSLCYDGGSPSHLESVAPCLEALGLQATFYAPSTAILDNPTAWRSLADFGHEIGLAPYHDWVADDGTLEAPSESLVACAEDDLRLLNELFGARKRSLGLPLPLEGSAKLRRERAEALAGLLPAELLGIANGLRTGIEGTNDLRRIDPFGLRTLPALSQTADSLRGVLERDRAKPCWHILTFHGVGCGDPAVDAVEHAAFCLWLAENRTTIEVATVSELCARVARAENGVAAAGDSERARTVRKP
ncbi:MAG: polysaccharide deacetylase family protein [Fimbriimonadales bacterium]|nr:polysaccharide deacetylase family protein [Fimbriimonadales bacterium]